MGKAFETLQTPTKMTGGSINYDDSFSRGDDGRKIFGLISGQSPQKPMQFNEMTAAKK